MFWHLNPKKLEPFFKAKKMETDNSLNQIKIASHQTGFYVMHAVASVFGDAKYPQVPFDMEDSIEQQEESAKPLTDAEKFEMWMIVHNEQLKRKREAKKQNENKSETGGK